ncbi:MAG TPA: ABC transporter permease [Lachnospiraceae bacterium]|nr:ABC transporter permease [Lachnospiraceae bacterium]
MNRFQAMTLFQVRRRAVDGFAIGYNIIFPIVLITILGSLLKGKYDGVVSSYQYYTIVLIPFCTIMAIITAAYAGKEDAFCQTAIRVIMSPLSKGEIVLAKILSCTIVYSICNVVTLLIAKMIWKVSFQREFFPVVAILSVTAFCVSALGVLIGLGMKNFLTVKNVINIPISIFGVAAGTFFPLGTLDNGLQFLLNLSPLTWINRSIFLYLYDGSKDLLWTLVGIMLVVGATFTYLAMKCFRREEYLNGKLPSSEK